MIPHNDSYCRKVTITQQVDFPEIKAVSIALVNASLLVKETSEIACPNKHPVYDAAYLAASKYKKAGLLTLGWRL